MARNTGNPGNPITRWLAVAALCLAPLGASAYGSLVIFGDSLSDSGNNADLLGIDAGQVITGNSYVPTNPYASGTYSNADVWATSFAAGLGLQAEASRTGGTNYAYGGAETRGAVPPSLRSQVNQFAATSPTGVADTLFVIAGGGNNARSALDRIAGGASIPLTVQLTVNRYVSDVGLMVDQLQALGAQHIVVWNTPDLGLVPAVLAEGAQAASLASSLSAQMNTALATRLAGEQGVLTFDVFGLLGDAVAHPGTYGFTNVTDACGALATCTPDSYLFWDGIHPTSGGHAIIAQGMTSLVSAVPEPQAWLMLAGGLAVLVLRRRALQ